MAPWPVSARPPEDERLGSWLARLLPHEDDRPSLAEQLERIIMGSSRCCTRDEVARRSGVAQERSARLWRALGFADVDDDDVVFTDVDINAVTLIDGLVRSGLVDPVIEAAAARAAGQSLSRLAEWEVGLLSEYVVARLSTEDLELDQATIVRYAELLLQTMEQLHSYVWRRHVAALIGRALASSPDEVVSTTLAVGFADVVGYTRLSRQLSEQELVDLLERFESTAAEEISRVGGRLVKSLGDEVLFVATSPDIAATIGLALTECMDADPVLPRVRIGMAWGHVLRRFGDVYGPVVNIASRLTSAAKPGHVLIDQHLVTALVPDDGFTVRALRPKSVRGYSNLPSWRLDRAHQRSSESGMIQESIV